MREAIKYWEWPAWEFEPARLDFGQLDHVSTYDCLCQSSGNLSDIFRENFKILLFYHPRKLTD
jgi:hypothetical protein